MDCSFSDLEHMKQLAQGYKKHYICTWLHVGVYVYAHVHVCVCVITGLQDESTTHCDFFHCNSSKISNISRKC